MLNVKQRALRQRIDAQRIGPENVPISFTHRLASENRWSHDYAERVIQEYKRFLFLAVAAGHPVSPSDQVDQAWHLHLIYTEDYWRKWCGEILNKPLHHGPTKGGRKENDKFGRWYAETLESYTRLFGETPPEDIWPAPHLRFRGDNRFVRVNLRENWLVPKPSMRAALSTAVGAVSAVLLGCSEVEQTIGQQDGLTFLKMFGGLSLFCAAISYSNWSNAPRDERGGRKGDVLRAWPLAIVLVVGLLRLLVGLSRGKPVGYLVLMLLADAGCFLFFTVPMAPGSGGGSSSGCTTTSGCSTSSGCSSSGSSGCGGGGCGGCGGGGGD